MSREQNFLNLGADNFDAMKLVSLARNEGWSIELEKILEAPKLKDIAANMRAVEKGAADYGEPPKPFALLGDEKAAKEVLVSLHRLSLVNIMLIWNRSLGTRII